MRRILIDNARRKRAEKHGGGMARVGFEDADIPMVSPDDKILEMHDALSALEAKDPVKAEVVKLRYFVGLSNAETAEALDLSVASVERYWAYAKGWLMEYIIDNE
jgi:RNA polymerase sigma factor (TIGR02999 family)